MKNKKKPSRLARGTTLIEVLIAMFILTIGLLGAGAMIPLGDYAVRVTRKNDTASLFARSVLHSVEAAQMLEGQIGNDQEIKWAPPSLEAGALATGAPPEGFEEYLTSKDDTAYLKREDDEYGRDYSEDEDGRQPKKYNAIVMVETPTADELAYGDMNACRVTVVACADKEITALASGECYFRSNGHGLLTVTMATDPDQAIYRPLRRGDWVYVVGDDDGVRDFAWYCVEGVSWSQDRSEVYLLVSGPTWDGDATATVYNGVVAVCTGQVDVFEPDKE